MSCDHSLALLGLVCSALVGFDIFPGLWRVCRVKGLLHTKPAPGPGRRRPQSSGEVSQVSLERSQYEEVAVECKGCMGPPMAVDAPVSATGDGCWGWSFPGYLQAMQLLKGRSPQVEYPVAF